MTEDIFERWIDSAVRIGNSDAYSLHSEHLDTIAPLEVPASLDEAARLVSRLQVYVDQHHKRGTQIAMALPAGTSSTLLLEPPPLDRWPYDRFEPPSIYLFLPTFRAWPGLGEEYRLEVLDAGVQAEIEYVCSRTLAHRDRGWEYSLVIWLFSRRGNLQHY